MIGIEFLFFMGAFEKLKTESKTLMETNEDLKKMLEEFFEKCKRCQDILSSSRPEEKLIERVCNPNESDVFRYIWAEAVLRNKFMAKINYNNLLSVLSREDLEKAVKQLIENMKELKNKYDTGDYDKEPRNSQDTTNE